MSPLEAMMSMEDIDPEKLRMLAEQMRGRASDGGALSTSTIGPVAEQGAFMQKEGMLQAGNIGDMQYRKEALKAQKADSLLRAVSAARTAAGKAKETKFHKASGTATQKYEDKANTIANIQGLVNRWSPDYVSSLPMSGPIEEFMGRNNLIPSTDKQEEMAAWWSDWKRDYENIVRHDLFGSALTQSEKEEWKKANISSNMDPEIIASKMATLQRLNSLAASRSVRSAINKDWDPRYALEEYEGVVPDYVMEEGRGGLDRWVRESRQSYGAPSPIQERGKGGPTTLQDLSDDEFNALLQSRGM